MTADGKKMLLPILAVIAVHLWSPTGGHVINRRASSILADEINHQRGRSYIANETLCIVDDKVYQRGDPVPADDHCERCTCRPPGFSCVLRDCHVKPGCKAVRQVGECCPEYICGCWHNNKEYKNGEIIRDLQNACYTCRCHGSSISCTFADCLYRTDCQPEYVQGECCPRYDHCPPLSTSTTVVTPSTTTPGIVQQEITFINITTQHLQKFTAEDTTVSIEEITPVISSTTTPATESTRFSVKFTLTSENAESSTPLPLHSVGFTETTRYVTPEEFSSSRTGLLDENTSSVSDSGIEIASTQDSTTSENISDNISAIITEDIKYSSTTDSAFENVEELEAEETKSSIYSASGTSLPESVSVSEETHGSSHEIYPGTDSSTIKSESTFSVIDESSQVTRLSETSGDIQPMKQEGGTEQHADESTVTATVNFIQSHSVMSDESSHTFDANASPTTGIMDVTTVSHTTNTTDIDHATEQIKDQDDAIELIKEIYHTTELITTFDVSTELTKEFDDVTELNQEFDNVTELKKGIDHVTELTKYINNVTEPTHLEVISELVESQSVSYVPIDDTKNEILQTQSTEDHSYENKSTEKDNHVKESTDSDLENHTENYAEHLPSSVTSFDAKCSGIEGNCKVSSEFDISELTSQHPLLVSENTTQYDEREYQQNTYQGSTEIPQTDHQSHVTSYKVTTESVTDEGITGSTSFDKLNITSDGIISSESDEIENEGHESFQPTDFYTTSEGFKHDSSDSAHKVTETNKSEEIFPADSSTAKVATEYIDGSLYTTSTKLSSFDEVENIKNELVTLLESEDISYESKSSSVTVPEEELEATSEIITSEILPHSSFTTNVEGDSSITNSEIIANSLKPFSIDDRDSQDKEVLNDNGSEANSSKEIHKTSGLQETPSSSTEYITTDHSGQNTETFKSDIASSTDESYEMEGEELSTNIMKFETTTNVGETSVGHTEGSSDNPLQITKSDTLPTNKEYDAINDVNDNNEDESSQILVTVATLEAALLHTKDNSEDQTSHGIDLDEDSYTKSYLKDKSTESVEVDLTSTHNTSFKVTGMQLDNTESSSTSAAVTYDADFGSTRIAEHPTEFTERISTVSQSNSPLNDSKTESNEVYSPDLQPLENPDNNETNEDIALDHNDMLPSQKVELSTESNNIITDNNESSEEVTTHRNDMLSTKVTEFSADSHLSFETAQENDTQKSEFTLGSHTSPTESDDKDVKSTPSSKTTETFLFASTFTESNSPEIDILEGEEEESQDIVKSNTVSYDTASVVTLNTGYASNYTSQEEPHGIPYSNGATYEDRTSTESTIITDLITKHFELHATEEYTEIEKNEHVNETDSIRDKNKFLNPSHDTDPDFPLISGNADNSDAKFSFNTISEDINEAHTTSHITFPLDTSNTATFEEEMRVSVSSEETISTNTKNNSETTTKENDDRLSSDNEHYSGGQDSLAKDIVKIDIHRGDQGNTHSVEEKFSPSNSTDEYDVLDAEEDIFHQVSTYKEQPTSLSAHEFATSSTEATNGETLTSIETSAYQTLSTEINAERTHGTETSVKQTSNVEINTSAYQTLSTEKNAEQTSGTETSVEQTSNVEINAERRSSILTSTEQTLIAETSAEQASSTNAKPITSTRENAEQTSSAEMSTEQASSTNAQPIPSTKANANQTSSADTSTEQALSTNTEPITSTKANAEQTSSADTSTEQALSTNTEPITSTKANAEQTSSTKTNAEQKISTDIDIEETSSTKTGADETSSTETSVDQTSDTKINAEKTSSTEINAERTLYPQTTVQSQVAEHLSDDKTSNIEYFATDPTEKSSINLATRNSIFSDIEYKITSQAQTNETVPTEKDNNNNIINGTTEDEEFDPYDDEEQDSEPIPSEDYVDTVKDEKVHIDKEITLTSDITSEKPEMKERTTIISILFGRNDYLNYPTGQNTEDVEEYVATEESLKQTGPETEKTLAPEIGITTETDSENEESTNEGPRNGTISDILSNLSPSVRYVTGRNLNTMDDILNQSNILSNSYTQLTSNSNEIQDVVNTEAISQENIMERRKNVDTISTEGKAVGSSAQEYLTELVSPNNTQTGTKISDSETSEFKKALDADAYSAYGYLGGVFITGNSKYSAETSKRSSSKNMTGFLNATQKESDNNNQFANLNKSVPITTVDDYPLDSNIDTKIVQEERAEIAAQSRNAAEIYLKNETEIEINNVTGTSEINETETSTPDITLNVTIEHFQIINNGPEKGGEWFEPTLPEIPFRKNIDASRTDPGSETVTNGNDEEITQSTIIQYSITTDLNNLLLKENKSKVTDDIILSDISDNNVTPHDDKSTFISSGTLVNDMETTTIPKTLPPLPIYLRDFSELKTNTDKLKMNQNEISRKDLLNHQGYSSLSTENYTTINSTESKTSIPPRTIIDQVTKSSQNTEKIEKLPSYSMVDVISNVFKAPGYDSEVHARNLYEDKPVFIVKRDAKEPEILGSTENTEIISTTKEKYPTEDSVTMKGALLVEGYGKKSGHFFPVTSSFIIVESPEDNETSKGDWTEVVLSDGSTVKHKKENSGSRK